MPAPLRKNKKARNVFNSFHLLSLLRASCGRALHKGWANGTRSYAFFKGGDVTITRHAQKTKSRNKTILNRSYTELDISRQNVPGSRMVAICSESEFQSAISYA